MKGTLSQPELIKGRVNNFLFTLNGIVNQLRNANPNLHVFKGGNYDYHPSGLIERVRLQLSFAFTQENRINGLEEGLYYEKCGTFDHRKVQSFLEETAQYLRDQHFENIIALNRFYLKFQESLWKFRD